MSGVFSVQFNAISVSAVQDLFAILAGANQPCVVLGYEISQVTDHGDAAEEQLPVLLRSGATVAGTGGNAPTPIPTDTSGAALSTSAFTARTNDATTQAGTGTVVVHHATVWNTRMPLQVLFTQEQQILLKAGRRIVLALGAAPSGARVCSGTMWLQEIG